MQAAAGFRSLVHARQHGSTSRVIDIARLTDRFYVDQRRNNAVYTLPFNVPRLNHSMIIKHTLRPYERTNFIGKKYHATKIIFPMSRDDLSLGGYSIFFGEIGFQTKLLRFLDCKNVDVALEKDLQLLSLFDSVPTFDPFLLTERAICDGLNLPTGLLDVSSRDLIALRQSVANSLTKIVKLAIGGANDKSAFDKVTAAFLIRDNAQALEPLRNALRMLPDEFSQVIYSWKGILFYTWRTEEMRSQLVPFINSLKRVVDHIILKEYKIYAQKVVREIVIALNNAIAQTDEIISNYNESIHELSVRQSPDRFIEFLRGAPRQFVNVGGAVGLIMHCMDYWRYALENVPLGALNDDGALELLHGLLEPFSNLNETYCNIA